MAEVRASGESVIYDPSLPVPDSCPAKVKAQFLAMRGAPERNVATETEDAKRKQAEYNNRISDAKRY